MRFFWRIQKRFVISDHMDSSLQKMENPKIKDHLPWQRHVLVLLVEKKNNTLIPTAKTRKKNSKYGMTVT